MISAGIDMIGPAPGPAAVARLHVWFKFFRRTVAHRRRQSAVDRDLPRVHEDLGYNHWRFIGLEGCEGTVVVRVLKNIGMCPMKCSLLFLFALTISTVWLCRNADRESL